MGKANETRPKPRKDSFFKKQGKPRQNRTSHPFGESFRKIGTDKPFPSQSTTDSGSFFVTPSEKQEILQKKEAKKSEKFGRERNVKSKVNSEEKPKKQFDKKQWRLQKYSKKYKLEQWEDKRKKAVLHQYYKQIKDDEPKFDVQKIYEQYQDDDDDEEDGGELNRKQEETENENNLNNDITEEKASTSKEDTLQTEPQASTSQTRKKKAYKKAHLEFQRIKDEKRQRKEELEKKKAERAEALKEYKQNKLEKYKKLNKKTKKGQPIMKYRMEMLLEQIQKSVK